MHGDDRRNARRTDRRNGEEIAMVKHDTETLGGSGSMATGSEFAALTAEIAKTQSTADRMAREGVPEGADPSSVLAGLISQLAEQVERLCRSIGEGSTAAAPDVGALLRDRALEEDISPEDAPAEPRRDPDVTG